ncbi:MAG: hypothetical protein KY459_00780 [Acidobacteria bacterium]|nr:hypothetical protein [Acidobacteriota bacterium]
MRAVAGGLILLVLLSVPLFAARPAQTRLHVGKVVVIDSPTVANLEMIGGSLRINAPIDGDVVVLGTRVRFDAEGRVDGNLYVLGGAIDGANSETVSGKIVAGLGTRVQSDASSDAHSPGLGVIELQIGLALLWLLLSVVLTIIAPRPIRIASVETRISGAWLFFLGLVAVSSLAVTALVASWALGTGLGEIILVATAAAAVAAKIFGMVVVFHALGTAVAGPRSHEAARSSIFRGDLSRTVTGLAILTAIRFIPIVGNIVWITLSVVGIGAAFGTLFGRREPAFLEVRTVPLVATTDRNY